MLYETLRSFKVMVTALWYRRSDQFKIRTETAAGSSPLNRHSRRVIQRAAEERGVNLLRGNRLRAAPKLHT